MNKRFFRGVYYTISISPKDNFTYSRYVGLINFGKTYAICEHLTQIKCKSNEEAIEIAKNMYCDKVEKRTYNDNGMLIKTEIIFN